MRDDHMGGLLAFVIAAPIMVICCGGGGVILAAILGGIGGWLTGLGGIATIVAALGAMLVWREIRRSRARRLAAGGDEATCCAPGGEAEAASGEPTRDR
jgi:hypothetical protein